MQYKNISFIVPSYNSENVISKSIESILNQDYKKGKTELIVIDDGSIDNSLKIISKYKNDKRVKVIDNKKNIGYVKSLNRAIKAAKYELICIVICDQVLNSKKWLEEMVEIINRDKKIVTVGAIVEIPKDAWENYPFIIKVILTTAYEKQIKKQIKEGRPSLFKKDILKKMGLYDERFDKAGEDSDLRLKLIKEGYKIETAKKARLFHYHGDYYKNASVSYELFKKALPLAEAAGAVYRKHKFLHGKYWNHLTSTIVYIGLLIPYIRYASLAIIGGVTGIYTYKILKYTKSWKFIFIPIFKVSKDIISIIGFWKGFITKKQSV